MQPEDSKYPNYMYEIALFLGFTDWYSRIRRDGSKILCWSVAFEKTDIPVGI